MSEQGRKYDGGKLRYDLIPVLALEDMVKGLTFGTIKYDDNNWVKVPNGRKRYLAAALRHIQEYRKGVLWDEEQNIHHLSAAMNNLSFIVEKDLRGWDDNSEEPLEETTEFQTEEEEDISEDVLKNYVNTLNVKVVDDKFQVTPKLWYPPVEDGGNPWIEWNEGEIPGHLSGEEFVDILMRGERDSQQFESDPRPAISTNWDNNGCSWNVVAYRVVESRKRKLWCETCEGVGHYDNRDFGVPREYRNSECPCPDCDGKGYFEV